MKNDGASNRLQSTLDDLKRRMQQERQAAESLTHHLTAQRDQGRVVEESRIRKLESELADAQRQWAEQKAVADKLSQQLANERSGTPPRVRELEQELDAAESRFQRERDAGSQSIESCLKMGCRRRTICWAGRRSCGDDPGPPG